MSVRDRMLLRDLWHLRGQVLATALVIACGIATLLAMRSAYHSLLQARSAYYLQYRLGDVFAQLKRAPQPVADEIARLPGVAGVQPRIVRGITLDVPGLSEPATALLIGMPVPHRPVLNDLHLVRGRYLRASGADEVIASEAFAAANGLGPGARVGALINGRLRSLLIVGTAMSPEFVYEVASGSILPDNRRYGVLWMGREALEFAFSMRGAFNDISLKLDPGASAAAVITRVDRLLGRYGGQGAYDRGLLPSDRFVSDELGELNVMTGVLPGLFLAISAFLLYVTLARVVTLQRADIGLLKAFGHANLSVALHYLRFGLAVAVVGLALGIPAGLLLGRYFVGIYRDYFHFPELRPLVPWSLYAVVLAAALLAAAFGAMAAVRSSLALAPAEAMRPPAPAAYRGDWMQRFAASSWLRPPLRMIVRSVSRRPGRALLAVTAMICAVALMVVGRFAVDAVSRMLQVQFDSALRSDATISYVEPRSADAATAAARLRGVSRAESFRSTPVWLRHDQRARRVELLGVAPDAELRRVVDLTGLPAAIPRDGLVLGAKLAELLDVRVGERLQVEFLQAPQLSREVVVRATVPELLGLGAYMDAEALAVLMREAGSVSGAQLRVDRRERAALYAQLKRLPVVAGVTTREAMRASVQAAMDRSFLVMSAILVSFSSIIVVGIVYNSVRIALSERGHELASLRVLGFSRREVAFILLGEQGMLTLLAIPLGLLAGFGLCALLVPAFDRESFRLPLVVSSHTLALASLVALLAAAASGLLVARRLGRLDLVAVLKTRE